MRRVRVSATRQYYERSLLLAELKACSRRGSLERGKQVHAEATLFGHATNVHVESALLNMYAKCGSMVGAQQVFEAMQHPDVAAWTVLISGYAENGQGFTALALFKNMKSEGLIPDSVTFVAALKACTSLAAKGDIECGDRGKALHGLAVDTGCSSIYLQSTLIDFYAKCGSMVDAHQVFTSVQHPNVVSWTALILGYADNGEGAIALNLFTRMRSEGVSPSSVTFVAALKACTSLLVNVKASECTQRCKEIHNLSVEDGCDSDIYVQSTLMDMYIKCRSMLDARQLFATAKLPDVVSWNALILGYADNGEGFTALSLFTRMLNEGPAFSSVTLMAVLRACTSVGEKGSVWTGCGIGIHNLAVESGCDSDVKVQNTLIDMYAKCSRTADARRLFDSMKHRNVVSWTALILGYADNGQGLTALSLFMRMRSEGPPPNYVTFAAALKVCGLVGGLEFGRTVHSEMDSAHTLDVVSVNCLVDFYAKCGSMVEALSVFESQAGRRNVVTWTALLAGFSSCGDHKCAFEALAGMQDAGYVPDSVTFLCILACCNHAGLVEKGKECFDTMLPRYGVHPAVEHYTCMVDIFGRANRLEDAMALLESMPCSPNGITWMTILGACHKRKNVELGRLAFQSLIHRNDRDAAAYVLLGKIYESRGMLREREMVLGLRRHCERPVAESCWTNEAGHVHTFSLDASCSFPERTSATASRS